MNSQVKKWLGKQPVYRKIRNKSLTGSLPGFQKVPAYDVLNGFFTSLGSSRISMRAAAVSFNFFLAVFPSVIFLFTLTAYLPIDDFDLMLLNALKEVLPEFSYLAVENTIHDIISIQRGGLLSVGFLIAVFYATNGITSLILSFNAVAVVKETRPLWKIRLSALLLTFIVAILLISAITMMVLTNVGLNYLIEKGIINYDFNFFLISIGKWIIFYGLIYFTIAFLYYFGPSSSARPRFFSTGALLVSFLTVILLIGFSFFVGKFGRFNAIYGSVGALIALMVLINLNALLILAGHEFNAVLYHLHRQRKKNAQGTEAESRL